MLSPHSKYGPRALITGAAAGIGEAFAEALAQAGYELVLVDIDRPALEQLAARLQKVGSAQIIQADLTKSEDLARVEAALDDARVGLLISNAGISHMGSFTEISVEQHEQAVALNCHATLRLVHRAAKRMAQQGQGGIVIMSSNSGLIHSPFVANYAGTKAYGLALGEALYAELRPLGVDIVAVVAGLTRTPGLKAAGVDEALAGRLMVEPRVVAEGALRALGRGPRYIPNVRDRLGAAFLLSMLPRRAALALSVLTMRRLFPALGRR
jgi:short-subunit dehydrogenase